MLPACWLRLLQAGGQPKALSFSDNAPSWEVLTDIVKVGGGGRFTTVHACKQTLNRTLQPTYCTPYCGLPPASGLVASYSSRAA